MLIYDYRLNKKGDLNIMGMFNFISIIAFITTAILFIMSKKIGKIYLLIGFETLAMIFLYGYLPVIDNGIKSIAIFLIFSLMILVTSEIVGIGLYMFTRNNKLSVLLSVLTSVIMILVLFNIKGIISYIYIPVLIFKLQEYINNSIIISEK